MDLVFHWSHKTLFHYNLSSACSGTRDQSLDQNRSPRHYVLVASGLPNSTRYDAENHIKGKRQSREPTYLVHGTHLKQRISLILNRFV